MKRTILYHKNHGSKIFTEEQAAEYYEALESGWVDAPWEVDNPDYKVKEPYFPKPIVEEMDSEDFDDLLDEPAGYTSTEPIIGKKRKAGRPKKGSKK